MQKQHFSIKIKTTRQRVWNILWEDKTFRDWASVIDEGLYLVGELKEGSEVQFNSASGYGVKSLVEKYIQNELVVFRHLADTKDNSDKEREKEWTGGMESYSLRENDGITILTVDMDVPPEQEELFKTIMPKALERVKVIAEKKE